MVLLYSICISLKIIISSKINSNFLKHIYSKYLSLSRFRSSVEKFSKITKYFQLNDEL